MISARSFRRRAQPAEPTLSGGGVVWLTGLPCSGKSTIASLLSERLRAEGRAVEVFDGDRVRQSMSADLGFSRADRIEQSRRVAMAAQAVVEAGGLAVVAVVSPTREARQAAREVLGDRYLEVHVDAPLWLCEARDVKGMYKLARAGRLPDFTGVAAPYERSERPALRVDTQAQTPGESVEAVVGLLGPRCALDQNS